MLLMCFGTQGQTRFDYFFLEAEKCRLAEDYSSALELYRHCLDINPDAPEAVYQVAIMQIGLRQDSLGVEMLRRACSLDSGNVRYLETLASVYLNKRNTEEVVPVLEKMAALQTRRSDILFQLASIYRTQEQPAKAIRALNRIELLEGKNVQLTLQKYALYAEMGQQDSAFNEIHSLCREYPNDQNYRVLLGNQYLDAGMQDSAMAVYEDVRCKAPDNMNLALAMMTFYQKTGQTERYMHQRDSLLFNPGTGSELRVMLMRDFIDQAQADTSQTVRMQETFDSLLAMPQKDAQLLTLKAGYQIYKKAGEDQVAETLKRILDVEPANQMAMSQLLQYYAPRNDYAAIEDLCRRGVNYYPDELVYYYYLGLSLYQQDKPTEAADAFRQGLRVKREDASPQLVSDFFSILGDLYYQQERPEEAFAAYDSSLVYMEDNVSCLNNYAYYLCLRGERLDDAEQMSYKTIKAEPNNIVYLDTYAWILFVKGNYANAKVYIDRVVNPQATDEELFAQPDLQGNLIEHAGDIYIMCGKRDEALRYWKLALQKNDATCTEMIKKKIKRKKYLK